MPGKRSLMKTEEEAALSILLPLLLARELVHLGVTSKHSTLLIRGYPALQQRPAGYAANYPPHQQHNGAIITAVTTRLCPTASFYLAVYITHSQPINSPATSLRKSNRKQKKRTYSSTCLHYVLMYVSWGLVGGYTWLRLQRAG